MNTSIGNKTMLVNLPSIDIRACVFANTAESGSSTLFNEISDRLVAASMICADTLGLEVAGTEVDWSSISKNGVTVQLQTVSGNKSPLLIRWNALENIETMSQYAKEIATPIQH